jgi:iron complex outermembrane recepter protein
MSLKMPLEPLVTRILLKGLISGAVRMKSGLISDRRSVGLVLAVFGSLVKPAAGTQAKELSSIDSHKPHSVNSAQLLGQNHENLVTKVTGIQVTSTDKGIEILLESANAEALQSVINNQSDSFIADIPNAVLELPNGGGFSENNPVPGIVSISVVQVNTNTLRITVISEEGLPQVELFDSEQGLIFDVASVTSSSPTDSQPQTSTELDQSEEPSASNELIDLVVSTATSGCAFGVEKGEPLCFCALPTRPVAWTLRDFSDSPFSVLSPLL